MFILVYQYNGWGMGRSGYCLPVQPLGLFLTLACRKQIRKWSTVLHLQEFSGHLFMAGNHFSPRATFLSEESYASAGWGQRQKLAEQLMFHFCTAGYFLHTERHKHTVLYPPSRQQFKDTFQPDKNTQSGCEAGQGGAGKRGMGGDGWCGKSPKGQIEKLGALHFAPRSEVLHPSLMERSEVRHLRTILH